MAVAGRVMAYQMAIVGVVIEVGLGGEVVISRDEVA
jgi:hypothetical protein